MCFLFLLLFYIENSQNWNLLLRLFPVVRLTRTCSKAIWLSSPSLAPKSATILRKESPLEEQVWRSGVDLPAGASFEEVQASTCDGLQPHAASPMVQPFNYVVDSSEKGFSASSRPQASDWLGTGIPPRVGDWTFRMPSRWTCLQDASAVKCVHTCWAHQMIQK